MPTKHSARSHCPIASSEDANAAASATTVAIQTAFPKGVSQPALRALAAAGYTHLEQLADAREADLKALHGMGPKALGILGEALAAKGKSFRA
jgi:hypothetical protein